MNDERFHLTRELLASGELSKHLQDAVERGAIVLWSEEERDANRRRVLAEHRAGEDLWVFGFGSLMWNPAFELEEARAALVRGWHRRFCLWTALGRGTQELPGLMLGLEPGGSCRGMAMRIAAGKIEEETRIIWRREMLSGAYVPTWVEAETDRGTVRAVTFAINRAYERYTGRLSFDVLVRHIATAEGPIGPCIEYLEHTCAALDAIGHSRGPMHDLLCAAREARQRHLAGR